MGTRRLSVKQQRILDFLRDFIAEREYPPSFREIQNACALSSTSMVYYNLSVLEQQGYICREREIARAITLTVLSRSVALTPTV